MIFKRSATCLLKSSARWAHSPVSLNHSGTFLRPLKGNSVYVPKGNLAVSLINQQLPSRYALAMPSVQANLLTGTTTITASQLLHTSASRKKSEQFILTDIGEGIKDVVLLEWDVKVGDRVQEFDPICKVQSDKATVTIPSRFEGTITKLYYEIDDKASVGKPLVDIEVQDSAVPSASQPAPAAAGATASGGSGGTSTPSKALATSAEPMSAPAEGLDQGNNRQMLPSVRRLAKELSIDLSKVESTGKFGRILKEDVLLHLQKSQSTNVQQQQSNASQQLSRSNLTSVQQKETRVPLRGIREAMFKIMTKSLSIPHFSYTDEIDMTKLMAANGSLFEQTNEKVATLAYLLKLVSVSLLEFPQLNASIEIDGEEVTLVHKHQHNIGVAIDTKAGLIVPNIKSVNMLSIRDIQLELGRLRELAYTSRLGPDDLKGGTITVSNIGAIGGLSGAPVIVEPEILIVALGRTRILPRFNSSGQVEARHIMQIGWSGDHRVVDGATLCRFSNLFKQLVEEPQSALLRLK